MKTHYLYISYQGQKVNGEIVLGDCLVKITNLSLMQIREYLKNEGEPKSSIVITHISELSKGLYEILSKNTEEK